MVADCEGLNRETEARLLHQFHEPTEISVYPVEVLGANCSKTVIGVEDNSLGPCSSGQFGRFVKNSAGCSKHGPLYGSVTSKLNEFVNNII